MQQSDYRIFVLGGGFLGSHVARYLNNQGYNTVIGSRSMVRSDKQVTVDLMDREMTNEAINDFCPTAIIVTGFDLSCDVSNNMSMVNNVIESKFFKQFKPRMIYFSSCAEYGASDDKNNIYKETAPQNPINKYGETKAIITNHLIKNIEDCSILRIFNPYSRNLSNRFFLGRLWETIKQDKPEREFIISCANDIRDFLNIDLLNRVIKELICRDESVGVLNIASGQGITIAKLAQTIIQRFAHDKLELIIDVTTPNSASPFSVGSTDKLLSLGIIIKELEI